MKRNASKLVLKLNFVFVIKKAQYVHGSRVQHQPIGLPHRISLRRHCPLFSSSPLLLLEETLEEAGDSLDCFLSRCDSRGKRPVPASRTVPALTLAGL